VTASIHVNSMDVWATVRIRHLGSVSNASMPLLGLLGSGGWAPLRFLGASLPFPALTHSESGEFDRHYRVHHHPLVSRNPSRPIFCCNPQPAKRCCDGVSVLVESAPLEAT